MKRYRFGQCNLIIQRLKKVDQKHSQKKYYINKTPIPIKKTLVLSVFIEFF